MRNWEYKYPRWARVVAGAVLIVMLTAWVVLVIRLTT
jgi:hypothetical protein